MKLFLKFITLLFISQSLYGAASIEEVIKDTFYVGKTSKKPELTFVMERVSNENIKDWLHYAEEQTKLESLFTTLNYDRTFTLDGSNHFKMCLKNTSYSKNEIWVSYITTDPNPEYNPQKFSHYSSKHSLAELAYKKHTIYPLVILPKTCFAAQQIAMFVTVTSSLQALATSHMGISKTLESIVDGNKFKGISMDIHSFSAQVMLMRNPKRRYMVNAPVALMEKIIAKNLPTEAVAIGEKSEIEKMLQKKNATLETMLSDPEEKFSTEKKSLTKKLNFLEKRATEKLALYNKLLQVNSKEETLQNLNLDPFAQIVLTLNEESNLFEINSEKYENEKQKIEKDALENYKINRPWKLFIIEVIEQIDIHDPVPDSVAKKFYEFLENHPPLIETFRQEFITLYDSRNRDTVLIDIDKTNLNYNWFFTTAFEPAGSTHYVVTDLKVLADFSFKL